MPVDLDDPAGNRKVVAELRRRKADNALTDIDKLILKATTKEGKVIFNLEIKKSDTQALADAINAVLTAGIDENTLAVFSASDRFASMRQSRRSDQMIAEELNAVKLRSPSLDPRAQLADALKQILDRADFFSSVEPQVKVDKLSDDIQKLLKKAKSSAPLSGDELQKLNRAFLAQIYNIVLDDEVLKDRREIIVHENFKGMIGEIKGVVLKRHVWIEHMFGAYDQYQIKWAFVWLAASIATIFFAGVVAAAPVALGATVLNIALAVLLSPFIIYATGQLYNEVKLRGYFKWAGFTFLGLAIASKMSGWLEGWLAFLWESVQHGVYYIQSAVLMMGDTGTGVIGTVMPTSGGVSTGILEFIVVGILGLAAVGLLHLLKNVAFVPGLKWLRNAVSGRSKPPAAPGVVGTPAGTPPPAPVPAAGAAASTTAKRSEARASQSQHSEQRNTKIEKIINWFKTESFPFLGPVLFTLTLGLYSIPIYFAHLTYVHSQFSPSWSEEIALFGLGFLILTFVTEGAVFIFFRPFFKWKEAWSRWKEAKESAKASKEWEEKRRTEESIMLADFSARRGHDVVLDLIVAKMPGIPPLVALGLVHDAKVLYDSMGDFEVVHHPSKYIGEEDVRKTITESVQTGRPGIFDEVEKEYAEHRPSGFSVERWTIEPPKGASVKTKAGEDSRSEAREELPVEVANAAEKVFDQLAVSSTDVPEGSVMVALGNPREDYPAYLAKVVLEKKPSKLIIVGNGVAAENRASVKPEWQRIKEALEALMAKDPALSALLKGRILVSDEYAGIPDLSMNNGQNIIPVINVLNKIEAVEGALPKDVVLVQIPQGLKVSEGIVDKQWNEKDVKTSAKPRFLTYVLPEYAAQVNKFLRTGDPAIGAEIMYFEKGETNPMLGLLKDMVGQVGRLRNWAPNYLNPQPDVLAALAADVVSSASTNLARLRAQRSESRKAEALTEAQKTALVETEATFGKKVASYVKIAMLYFARQEAQKKEAKAAVKEVESHYATDAVGQKVMADLETRYDSIEGNAELKQLAMTVSAEVLSLDGGLGEKLRRTLWNAWLLKNGLILESEVTLDANGQPAIGAKGTDMGYLIRAKNGKAYYVSVSGSKLIQLY